MLLAKGIATIFKCSEIISCGEFKSFLICKYFEKYKKNVYILEIKYRDKLGIRRKVELNPKEVYIKSLNISEKEAWKLIEKNCHYTIYVSKK